MVDIVDRIFTQISKNLDSRLNQNALPQLSIIVVNVLSFALKIGYDSSPIFQA